MTVEDSLIEWLTAALFLAGGIAAGFAVGKAHRRHVSLLTVLALAFLAVALLVVGFEEISWGQRIFDVETPEWLSRINMQQELNLHNISSGLAQHVAFLGGLLFGVLLPTVCMLSASARQIYETRLQLRAPGSPIVVSCLLGYAACKPEWRLPALMLSITYTCTGACLAAAILSGNGRRGWFDATVLAAGVVTALLMRMGLAHVGGWTNRWMEVGEFCLAGAACLLVLSTLYAPAPGNHATGSPDEDDVLRHAG
ncbi:MAG: hypothetical protein LGR52_07870 [Candidatus Thiosymbion ectosymbiont of Robbea hypermnestra]|nr:hypothetical protein [Candidatus Thiosymbion ectosymbiont of Robbea hypermnestra]